MSNARFTCRAAHTCVGRGLSTEVTFKLDRGTAKIAMTHVVEAIEKFRILDGG